MKQFDSPEDDDQEQKIQKGLEQILTGEVETHLLIFKFIRSCGFAREGTVLFNFAALVFLLAARQFANYVCIALAGSVGCEQKEQKKLQTDACASSRCRWPTLGLFFGPGILSGRDMRVFTPRAPENPDPKAIAKTEDCGA
ncbi:hypothetical protein [uncultured Rikenella sp.]|uniref:hypothetical protein n=1 Tax=uncultured Rikenella sp. TaxID=368003 RepID=UPI00272D677F|nr:hypothetical protein [uncultured Rikenella sp.]